MNATASIPSASVLAKKAILLEMRGTWANVRDPKTGQRCVAVPNETETRVYYVEPTGKACSCKAGQFGTLCAHRLAVIERANHEALETWLAEMAAPSVASRYEAYFPACRICRDLCDASTDTLCSRCLSDEARRLEQQAKSERMATSRARVLAEWTGSE